MVLMVRDAAKATRRGGHGGTQNPPLSCCMNRYNDDFPSISPACASPIRNLSDAKQACVERHAQPHGLRELSYARDGALGARGGLASADAVRFPALLLICPEFPATCARFLEPGAVHSFRC
ncbi:hypothetical protein [Paraburkholderia mimosarum]|uniref:hypothetical protein n=1 Tax=Paraburkholderia mimosarum TaxID=312026 RepID=UPI0012B54694|nr:hypothetical protein [Paraburkholderia mimosarum]